MKSLYELEKLNELFAAMWEVPIGSKVRVTNKENGRSVLVTVQDRGPNRKYQGRVIDLGKRAFSQIADIDEGLASVLVELVS